MLATLFVSHGVPMILAGDEPGQTQNGKNNAYCQDTDTTWIDRQAARPELIDAVSALTALRRDWRDHLSPYGFWPRTEATASIWFHPEGREMSGDDWQDAGLQVVGLRHQQDGKPDLLVALNAGEECSFALPDGDWRLILDTARDAVACDEPAAASMTLCPQAVAVLVA